MNLNHLSLHISLNFHFIQFLISFIISLNIFIKKLNPNTKQIASIDTTILIKNHTPYSSKKCHLFYGICFHRIQYWLYWRLFCQFSAYFQYYQNYLHVWILKLTLQVTFYAISISTTTGQQIRLGMISSSFYSKFS